MNTVAVAHINADRDPNSVCCVRLLKNLNNVPAAHTNVDSNLTTLAALVASKTSHSMTSNMTTPAELVENSTPPATDTRPTAQTWTPPTTGYDLV